MIQFELDCVPPSLNSMYRKFRNRVVLSQQAKDFKQLIADSVSDNFTGLSGKLHLQVTFMFADNRKRDIDNYLKVLLDAMKGILFQDDDQIFSMQVTKHIGCESPKTSITITTTDIH